ncbi:MULTISPECIES: YkvA family protein [unclassified Lentilitoribacter]|jgi:uncharacterized membrane protein YkvA (DUF1232 family)|uniref:YkvA family protein n=1 Tax=unclassified Lentilitoribacter TaxID=2647570 RepID=UPI0013A6FDD3|nr:YkvA family protein [Lentilitoribacter sp. Alg239-R112]
MEKKTISNKEIEAILKPASDDQQSRQEAKVRTKFWPTLRKAIAQFPFAEDIVAAYYCALDKQTPSHVKGVLLAALAYFILPIDLIPDFIAGIGFGDDLAVVTTALSMLQNHITDGQRAAAKKALAKFKTDNEEVH